MLKNQSSKLGNLSPAIFRLFVRVNSSKSVQPMLMLLQNFNILQSQIMMARHVKAALFSTYIGDPVGDFVHTFGQ